MADLVATANPERLAAHLASVFDLTVEHPAPIRIVLKRR
jgi:hypothetical protein